MSVAATLLRGRSIRGAVDGAASRGQMLGKMSTEMHIYMLDYHNKWAVSLFQASLARAFPLTMLSVPDHLAVTSWVADKGRNFVY